ncbi:hypothetical protein I5907_01410 [Panacibacter sp. DH6]|uniref:Uncharacterized protein n=1 Tax=Panacibacter microcysteis TaxID=2793269 RepID=A0A931GY81_9BACT|nr:hypothetical protein [Panacibacter microcysteis]MBG9374877.1 hypothetical protein [Panacibacter microcysteis]
MNSKLLVTVILTFLFFAGYSQARSYFDAAQMYNRLLLENENSVVQVGNFKVKGSPYLFGGRKQGQLFLHGQAANTSFISYNTYDQIIEFSNSGSISSTLFQPSGLLDSFAISANKDLGITRELIFIKGSFVSAQDSSFYQRMLSGSRFSLYKKYKSQLVIVSTNYVQSDLRQFDLQTEYYYHDSLSNLFKKMKTNTGFLKKEFKQFDLSAILESSDFSYDLDKSLIDIFQVLNK